MQLKKYYGNTYISEFLSKNRSKRDTLYTVLLSTIINKPNHISVDIHMYIYAYIPMLKLCFIFIPGRKLILAILACT